MRQPNKKNSKKHDVILSDPFPFPSHLPNNQTCYNMRTQMFHSGKSKLSSKKHWRNTTRPWGDLNQARSEPHMKPNKVYTLCRPLFPDVHMSSLMAIVRTHPYRKGRSSRNQGLRKANSIHSVPHPAESPVAAASHPASPCFILNILPQSRPSFIFSRRHIWPRENIKFMRRD